VRNVGSISQIKLSLRPVVEQSWRRRVHLILTSGIFLRGLESLVALSGGHLIGFTES
jgi:hypothetical protein